MKNALKISFLALTTIAVVACGGSDSDSNPIETKAKFSLGISDAPVDEATAVFIEIDSITLSDSASGTTRIDTFVGEDGSNVESIKVNLLDYQGTSQLKIVDESENIELDNGTYEMELNIIDSGSYVLLDGDSTEYDIKVPSSRLRLGEFEVNDEAVQVNDDPAYTIEFDLRQSLVLRGNANNNNGYIIKPHGVRIVSLAGDIEGTVSADLTNLGQCTVYLYDEAATEYGDMYDPNDESFVSPEGEITASAPLATALVATDGTYSIGFVQAGNYQVALTCGTNVDDNIQFDDLSIPDAADLTPDVQTITVTSQNTTTVNF